MSSRSADINTVGLCLKHDDHKHEAKDNPLKVNRLPFARQINSQQNEQRYHGEKVIYILASGQNPVDPIWPEKWRKQQCDQNHISGNCHFIHFVGADTLFHCSYTIPSSSARSP